MSDTRILSLEHAKREIVAGIDEAITVLKGSVEFRDAVEALLVGTPHEKPADARNDFEGLYGRLRNALKGGQR
jgi:hypothetical protein